MAEPYPETADIETASDGYAARFAGPVGAWMLDVQTAAVRRYLADSPTCTVLDVGGGHGQLARPLAQDGHPVTVLGSDASCSQRISDLVASGRCTFVVGNLVELPFADGAFEVVLAFRLVTHCEQWPALMAELCRVARRAVIIDYPTSQSVNAIAPALFGAKRKLEGNTRHWTLFRHRQIREAFAANGYGSTVRYGQFFLPMALHRMLKCRPISAALEAACRGLGLSRLFGSPVVLKAQRR